MITRSISKIASAFAAAAFLTSAPAAQPTLQQVTEETEAAVAKAPDKAAEIVTEKVTATPEYACPIIKAAIKGGNLAKEVQPDLVSAALQAAPDKAPEIKACLPNLMEGAAGKGGAAGKSGVTGKGPVGKGPAAPPVEDEIALPESGLPGGEYDSFYGVIGTYLYIPGGAPIIGDPKDEPIVVVTTGGGKPPKKVIISNPGTRSQAN